MRRGFLMCCLALGFLIGCNAFNGPVGPLPDPAEPDKPKPVEPQKPAEQDVWKALAALVRSGRVPHTDRVIAAAELLKSAGYLSDLSRLERWRSARTEIDSANAGTLAAQVEGGS